MYTAFIRFCMLLYVIGLSEQVSFIIHMYVHVLFILCKYCTCLLCSSYFCFMQNWMFRVSIVNSCLSFLKTSLHCSCCQQFSKVLIAANWCFFSSPPTWHVVLKIYCLGSSGILCCICRLQPSHLRVGPAPIWKTHSGAAYVDW